jgi:hypothetical protein
VVPDRPGIGVEVHEEMLARFPHRRHTTVGAFHDRQGQFDLLRKRVLLAS